VSCSTFNKKALKLIAPGPGYQIEIEPKPGLFPSRYGDETQAHSLRLDNGDSN
jgi:hypothetical protein